ncbi:hypothetical protein D9619_007187 [Psilocybe cf. subviscida]|uniref:Cytochrome P450 n=1 Tax=Psilocybe cf. subviscida TaxID=2480587 RepID=A0A8H5EWV8_9AGAR|nr:hypothetical protein D9619_007187 [Psilocybe cf. subviscida]
MSSLPSFENWMENGATSFLAFAIGALSICGMLTMRLMLSCGNRLPYPPGPPEKQWLSGHISILPLKEPWKVYTDWMHKYGSIIHVRLFQQHMIFLSTIEDCIELYEKRSTVYSDRPPSAMVDLMGWDFNLGLMPYGARWRVQRRLFQQAFKKDTSLSYRPEQTRKINDMLFGLLISPEEYRNHLKTVTAAIVMSITYGYDIEPKEDYFVNISEAAQSRLTLALIPGASLLNIIPALRFLPSWLPGTGFLKIAAETRELTTQMKEVPFQWVENNVANGKFDHCLVADRLTSSKTEGDIAALKDFAALIYTAGADTTTSSLETFSYAMAISPDVVDKAQTELDAVVGRDRLPNYGDHDSLPYIEAIVREVLRWRPVLPLSPPHSTKGDDVYKGYFIPKGAVIMTNVWAISRNEEKYKDPESFNPNRFFDADGNLNDDDSNYIFGFGRRICPGRHMARATVRFSSSRYSPQRLTDAQLWLSMACILALFDIGKAKDEQGNDIPITGEYTDSLVSHCMEHQCSIVPRFPETEGLIKEVVTRTKDHRAY